MFNTRVLITTYPEAFMYRGGGEVEIVDLHTNLNRLGVIADLYGPGVQPLTKYDFVLHYSVVPSGYQMMDNAKRAGKKVVLLPSLWWATPPRNEDIESVKKFFSLADIVVFRSKSELANVSEYVPVPEDKLSICRWGVDGCYDYPVSQDLFRREYGISEYLLSVGIIEENKNQLSAIKALKDFEMPMVFIGDYRNRAYYEDCIRSAPMNFKFIPHMPPKSEMLRSALAGCAAFVEVSKEPPGHSAFEAALVGAHLVLSEGPWVDEHFAEDEVVKVNPQSPDSIREGVSIAIKQNSAFDLQKKIRALNVLPQSLEPLAQILRIMR